MRKKGFNYLILVAVGVVAPWLLGLAGIYWMHTLVIAGIFSILAISLNLILGYTGQVSLAQTAYFGLGAYTSALLMIHFEVNFFVTLLAAGLIAVVLGLFIGYISLGMRGIYFALCNFAFLMLMFYTLNSLEIVEGSRGLSGIPPATIGGFVFELANKLAWFYLVFAFLFLAYFIVDRVVNSRVGRAFIAIREDEDLAKSTGVNTFRYKMLSLCISAFLAGIAGALYASYMGAMTPTDAAVLPMLMVLAACVIGGLGTMPGPIIGILFVQLMPEVLRPIEGYYYLIFSLTVLLVIIFTPSGIMGAIKSLQARLKARGSKEEVMV